MWPRFRQNGPHWRKRRDDIDAADAAAAVANRSRSSFQSHCGAAKSRSVSLRRRRAADIFQMFKFLPQMLSMLTHR